MSGPKSAVLGAFAAGRPDDPAAVSVLFKDGVPTGIRTPGYRRERGATGTSGLP